MSLTASIVLIEGDVLKNLNEIFAEFGYNKSIIAEESSIEKYMQMMSEYRKNKEIFAISKNDNWTIFLTSSFDMCIDEKALKNLSSKLHKKIISLYCEGTTDSVCYYTFQQGECVRRFELTKGEFEEFGERQSFELEYDKQMFYADYFVGILSKIGVSYEAIMKNQNINLKVFDTPEFFVNQEPQKCKKKK